MQWLLYASCQRKAQYISFWMKIKCTRLTPKRFGGRKAMTGHKGIFKNAYFLSIIEACWKQIVHSDRHRSHVDAIMGCFMMIASCSSYYGPHWQIWGQCMFLEDIRELLFITITKLSFLSYLGRRAAKERWCIAGVVVWQWEGDRQRKNRSSFLISLAHPSVLMVASSPEARPVTTWLLDIPAYLRRRGNHHVSKSASTVLTRWVTFKNFYFGMGEVSTQCLDF